MRPREFDRHTIVDRVRRFYDTDIQNSSDEVDARLQRYAKFRMVRSGSDFPWEDSSDVALPDMLQHSLRLSDSLHNAVMSQRPVMSGKARGERHRENQEAVSELIDHQVFIDQPGEVLIGDFIDNFVNDPAGVVFTPWVREFREISELRRFKPIPGDLLPVQYFNGLIAQEFPGETAAPVPNSDGWDWLIILPGEDGEDERHKLRFYTRGDETVEMVLQRSAKVFDGPAWINLDIEDVLTPVRAGNLQIPSPSNSHGASHVIIRDKPTIDEILRLHKSGVYNEMTQDDVDLLTLAEPGDDHEEGKAQKDQVAGQSVDRNTPREAWQHRQVQRLMCFDMFDIDGDGIAEDVVWWVLPEQKILLRAAVLTDVFPSNPPRRPLACGSMIPVPNRWRGIGALEMVEPLHDVMKILMDQGIDNGTISNLPFFFYRASSSVKSQVIELSPGSGYPVGDPQRDIHFPNIRNDSQAFFVNMITLINQQLERVMMQGDFQFGRVPTGKASALRTVGGMALLAGQGEARPERILRRMFTTLTEVWQNIHQLNSAFLGPEKEIRLRGQVGARKKVYKVIGGVNDIAGRFDFEFAANVLNTSKQNLQAALGSLMSTYISGIAVQLGIIDGGGVYRLMRDFGRAWGQDPDQYLTEPQGGANQPRIFAEQAIADIIGGTLPNGMPGEPGGAIEHLTKLNEFLQSDEFGILTAEGIELFQQWVLSISELAQAQQQQQQLAASADQFGQGPGQGQGGQGGARPGPIEDPRELGQTGPGEITDRSLPTAGGGASAAQSAG